jgi:ubiquitin-protein ligase
MLNLFRGAKRQNATQRPRSRDAYLLREFASTREDLDLPPNILLDFIDTANSGEDSAKKYETFIAHVSPISGVYAGGTYKIEFSVRSAPDFPFEPPSARMLTPIWHPNIDLQGHICHNYLKADAAAGEGAGYSPVLGMSGVVLGVSTLLESGGENPHDPLNPDAARQYLENYDAFAKKAQDWVKQHAKREVVPIQRQPARRRET